MPDSTQRIAAFAIIAAYLLLAATYSVITPAYEAPDEVGHFDYVVHLATQRSLPEQREGDLGAAQHPPLYYALAAIATSLSDLRDPTGAFRLNPGFIWAGNGGNEINANRPSTAATFPYQGRALGLHLARGISVLCGAITVGLMIAIGWLLFPEHRAIGLLAGALVAFNPQFLFISGAVNNDNLLITASTALWWQLLRTMRAPSEARAWQFCGVFLSVGILSKASALINAAPLGLALVWCAWRNRSLALLLKGGLAILATVAVLSTWWFIRNQWVYGDPLGWRVYLEVYAVNLRQSPLWPDLGNLFQTQFRSYWGVFGWMLVPAPEWFFAVVIGLVAAALIGWASMLTNGIWRGLSRQQRAGLALLWLVVIVQEAYMIVANTRFNSSWFQGRYLFSVIAPVAILLSVGLVNIRLLAVSRALAITAPLALLACAAYMPARVIGPAYQTVVMTKWEAASLPHDADIVFGDMVRLRGYEVEAHDPQRLRITLFWQAERPPDFDYSAFVHVLDAQGRKVAQNDHSPGASKGYPPSAWLSGDYIADVHEIMLDLSQASPQQVIVGLYNWSNGQRLQAMRDGAPAGDAFVIEVPAR